jgi:hypothetical protein
MNAAALVLVAALVSPVIAESCDMSTMTLDDVTETLTITNASASQSAVVLVTFSDASGSLRLAAGSSKTSTVVGADEYTIEVLAPALPAGTSYESSLLQIRKDLVGLFADPGDSGATLEGVVFALDEVSTALDQMHGSKMSQTCSHATATNGRNHATVKWSDAGVGGLWVLSCD